MPHKRVQRAKRSDHVDQITKAIAKFFGTSSLWTVPDLKRKRVKVLKGVIRHLHCSGYIKKEGTTRIRSKNGAICAKWRLTTKGKSRAGV